MNKRPMNSISNLINFNKSRLELGLRNTGLGRLIQRKPLFYSGILIYGL